MVEYLKPDNVSRIWADTGEKREPSSTKVSQGYGKEVPTYQDFNWLINRQDAFAAHINQHGIAMWDNVTPYLADISFVMGSNGNIYVAKIDNTNTNPVTDTSFTTWGLLFESGLYTRPKIAITPINGWIASGVDYFIAKVVSGILTVSCDISAGTTSDLTIIGVLPTGYRPSVQRNFIGSYFDGVNYNPCAILIESTGNILINGVGASNSVTFTVSMVIE